MGRSTFPGMLFTIRHSLLGKWKPSHVMEAYKIADMLFYISHLETAMEPTQFFILQDF